MTWRHPLEERALMLANRYKRLVQQSPETPEEGELREQLNETVKGLDPLQALLDGGEKTLVELSRALTGILDASEKLLAEIEKLRGITDGCTECGGDGWIQWQEQDGSPNGVPCPTCCAEDWQNDITYPTGD